MLPNQTSAHMLLGAVTLISIEFEGVNFNGLILFLCSLLSYQNF